MNDNKDESLCRSLLGFDILGETTGNPPQLPPDDPPYLPHLRHSIGEALQSSHEPIYIKQENIMEDFIEDEEIKGAKKDAKGALNAIKTILVNLLRATVGRAYRVLADLLGRFG